MVAVLLISTAFSQESINYFEKKNEINIQVDDIFAKQDFLNTLYYLEYDYDYVYYNYYLGYPMNTQPAIGIGYKHHFNKGAIRLKASLSIMTRNYENDQEDDDDNVFIGVYNERVAAGYEFHQNWGRTQVFYGIDGVLGFQTSVNKQQIRYTNEYGYLEESIDSKYVSATISYGIQPFLGFRYMISPRFSVSTEYHLLMETFVSKSRVEIEGRDDEESGKTRGLNTKFGPKGQLTFSYHF
jgi:hypothetical protein